ncbi:MAG: metal ABC transporter permease [Sedimentisphaerales bacterium]|nr:metal ABC transporter permease [Sedimentisphaerales bacterium]
MLLIIHTLGLPFLACVLMSFILGYLGTHVIKREVIFIDIALAQIAAVGAIVVHMLFKVHGNSLVASLFSFGCVLLAAGFYAFVRSMITQISLEAIIGISYAIAAAAALFLVGIAPGGHMHIQHLLSGSVLWTSGKQVIISLVVFSIVGICFYLIRKPIDGISNNYQGSSVKNMRTVFWDFIFYTLLGIIITISVQTAGIVVVFAYLIIPATISAVFSARMRLITVWTVAIIASLGGLLFAYKCDFSIGPAIAMFLGCELVIVGLIHKFRQTRGSSKYTYSY